MSKLRLISTLTQSVWAIHPEAAQHFAPLVFSLLGGDVILSEGDTEFEPFSLVKAQSSGTSGRSGQEVAVIKLHDVIVKDDEECGPVGASTVASWLQQIDNDKSVCGTVLSIDSPGGASMGMLLLCDAMKALNKPVVTHISYGNAASAAYGIAACSDHIMIEGSRSMVGSIGSYATLKDMKAYMEAKGIKVHEIYATESTAKNKAVLEAFEGKYEKYRESVVDPFNRDFIDLVKAARPEMNTDGDVLKGGMYFTREALENGMVDSIGSLQQAIDLVSSLTKKPQTQNSMSFFSRGTKLPKTEALLQAASETRTETTFAEAQGELDAIKANVLIGPKSEEFGSFSAIQDKMEATAKSLTEAKDKAAELQKEVTNLKSSLDEANKALTNTKAQLKTLEDSLENEDDLKQTAAPKMSEFEKLSAQFAHNKAADEAGYGPGTGEEKK